MITRSPALSTYMNNALTVNGRPSFAARRIAPQSSSPRSAGRVYPMPMAMAANWLITPPQA